MRMYKVFLVLISSIVMSGCQTNSSCATGTPSDKKLHYGVLSYEEGNYAAAITALQSVLETKLSSKREQVTAYKYLAFIQCVSGRDAMCRDSFKKALEINPGFNLEPEEAGHPTWGPAFKSVKSKFSK